VNTGTKKHIAVVTQIEGNGSVRVKISRNQCDGCKLGDICSVSSDDELELVCGNVAEENIHIGDRVIIEEQQSMEWIAIFYCLFLPCMLFLSIVIGLTVSVSVLCGCVSGVVALAMYYGLFYMARNKLKFNKINFEIKKL
jgi:hypothetical protein